MSQQPDKPNEPQKWHILRACIIVLALLGLGAIIFVAGCFGMLAMKNR